MAGKSRSCYPAILQSWRTGGISASLKPLTIAEFLAWERAQEGRYEFDGIQPVAMTGGSFLHARIVTRLIIALGNRVQPPCEAMGSELKVLTTGQVRYPDASVICTGADETSDMMEPKIVFEVLSPSTSLTDRRVKALEYANKASIQVYAILETERPEITVSRRATGWETEIIAGIEAMLPLPEIDIGVPLAAIHAC